MRQILSISVIVLFSLLVSCNEHIADNPLANQPPRTFLWLYPATDSAVGVGVSRQRIRWWGEDPDGIVTGYLFAYEVVYANTSSLPVPDTLRYSWVSKNDTSFVFPLDTLFRKFAVVVRAVDNTFRRLSDTSVIRMIPFPYLDRNDNGLFDAHDERLDGLMASIDPKGAVLTFPIRNTPPDVVFVPDPSDPTLSYKIPDTTYTSVTFSWTGSDPDGNNTLVGYRVALNDTANPASWVYLKTKDTLVTLVVPRARSDTAGAVAEADLYGGQFLGRQYLGRIAGLRLDATNVFYVEALDVAGEFSRPIRLPAEGGRWYVKRPRSSLLLVADYVKSDSNAAASTYLRTLRAIPGNAFTDVDRLSFGTGLTVVDKDAGKMGSFVPPFADPALIHTFLLYDYVFWYTDEFPNLGVAQLTLFVYIQNGGKVLFTTTSRNAADPRGALNDFAPIDSVSSVDLSGAPPPARLGDTRLPGNLRVVPDSSVSGNIYPPLAFNGPGTTIYSIFMRPIYRRSDARYLYHLEPDPRSPARYVGSPNIAVVDGQRTIIFVALPLHLLDNTNVAYGNPLGLTAFLAKVFTQEFNPSHRVDRRRF